MTHERRVGPRKTAMVMMAVVGGLIVLSAATCQPPGGGSSGTTTTIATGDPVAGCFDNTADNDRADYGYSGTPDVALNMTYHASVDGSCDGDLEPTVDTTLVLGATVTEASDTCVALGGNLGSSWYSGGWTGLPLHAYICQNATP